MDEIMDSKELSIEETQAEALKAVNTYFSPEEWMKLPKLQQEHYVAQLENYKFLEALGLDPPLPEFAEEIVRRERKKKASELKRTLKAGDDKKAVVMKKPQVKKEVKILKGKFGYYYGKVDKKVVEETDVDELQQLKAFHRKLLAPPNRENMRTSGWDLSRIPTVPSAGVAEQRALILGELEEGEDEKELENMKPSTSRYPKRNVPRYDYREDPEPDDDEYIYCDHCGYDVLGTCVDHGKPFRVLSIPAPPVCKDRAIRTLPRGLRIAESTIPGAGLGVFTDKPIPAFTQFGPYEGVLIDKGNNDGYCWQIRRTGKSSLSVDAQDIDRSGWMRYVDCALHDRDQNLMPYQHKGQIFYMTRRMIWPGEELLTWYGEEFMTELGIDMKAYFRSRPKTPPPPSLTYRSRGFGLKCNWCTLGFSSQGFVQRHVLSKHGSEHSLLVIQHKATVMFPPSESTSSIAVCFSQEEVTSSLMKMTSSSVSNDDKVVARRVLTKRSNEADENGLVQKLFACSKCDRSYSTKGRLNNHMKVHDESTMLKCPQCSYVTGIKHHLKAHMLVHSGEKLFQCDVCGQRFTQKSTLVAHSRVHTGSKPFECPHCDYKTARSSDFSVHLRRHTGDKRYSCSECDYICSDSSSLRRHMRTHSGETPFCCSECHYVTGDSGDLSRHMRTHGGETPFCCSECHYVTGDSGDLSRHMRTHGGDKADPCSDHVTTQSGSLTKHKRSHSGDRPFACTECDYTTANSGNLTLHMRTHTGDRPYACTECNYTATQSGHLTTHMRQHTGEKRYACTECHYKTAHSHHLTRHMRTHTGEKPFCCSECDYKTAYSSDLTLHMRTHTGAKPYACTECDYTTTQSGNLTTHMRTHTGNKPYACTQCGYVTTQSGSLTTHMRTHTGAKPYACTQCDYACTQSSSLKSHVQRHHQ